MKTITKFLLQYHYVLLFPFFALSLNAQNESIDSILSKSEKTLHNSDSLQFKCIRKQKFFSTTDTSKIDMEALLRKITNDTVGKAKFYVKYNDSITQKVIVEIYNDGSKYLSLNYDKKEGYFIDFYLMPPDYMKENMDPDFVPEYIFTDGNEISYILKQYQTNLEDMGDNILTILDSVYKIRFPIKDDSTSFSPNYNGYLELLIRKSDYFPIRYIWYTETVSLGERKSQYIEYNFSDIVLNPVIPDSTFDIAAIYEKASKKFIIHDAKPGVENYLDSMSAAPGFRLADANGDSVSLSSLRGKVVLLDFWYRSCYGCLMAIPDLEKLLENFKGQDVGIIGINGKPDETKFISKYKDKFNINYTICVNGDRTAKDYLVTAYPTFYIIDKAGRIRFSKIGYSEGFYKTLQEKIEQLLKEKYN